MSGTPRFLALDLLRLVLAMYVAAAHLDGAWNPAQGHLAVDFFFILSGFVLCAGYLPRAAGARAEDHQAAILPAVARVLDKILRGRAPIRLRRDRCAIYVCAHLSPPKRRL